MQPKWSQKHVICVSKLKIAIGETPELTTASPANRTNNNRINMGNLSFKKLFKLLRRNNSNPSSSSSSTTTSSSSSSATNPLMTISGSSESISSTDSSSDSVTSTSTSPGGYKSACETATSSGKSSRRRRSKSHCVVSSTAAATSSAASSPTFHEIPHRWVARVFEIIHNKFAVVNTKIGETNRNKKPSINLKIFFFNN